MCLGVLCVYVGVSVFVGVCMGVCECGWGVCVVLGVVCGCV